MTTPLPSRLRASAQVMRTLDGVSLRPSGLALIDRVQADHIARELEEAAQALEHPPNDSPRWQKLDALREMARQFVSHPVSRGISDCEEAGELMTDAAAEIERLCRVRNCLAGSARTRTARLHQLERQRNYLLAEMRRIDGDTGNAGHYASEAISAICAEEGADGAVRDSCEESAQSLRDLRAAALLALGLLWMTERHSIKVHSAYVILRDALGGKEALREGIQAAMDAGNEADHPHGADWWAGKKDAPSAQVAQEGAAGVLAADNWQQYAKDGETAQACIERHRREQDTLLKLLAQSREPLTSEQIIALLPAGWTGMLAQVMEFARRIEAARGVATDGGAKK